MSRRDVIGALAGTALVALPALAGAQLGAYNPPPGPQGTFAIRNARIVTVSGPETVTTRALRIANVSCGPGGGL